jgi:hypothetical protein
MPRQVDFKKFYRQKHERTYRKALAAAEDSNASGGGGFGGGGGNGSGVPGTTIDEALDSLNTTKADKTTQIIAGDGLTGGGDLSTDRTLNVVAGEGLAVAADEIALDIDGLTADATPDTAADYVATWDASAGAHKKALLSALGGSSVGALDDLSDVIITAPVSGQLLGYEASSFITLSGDMTDGDDRIHLSGDMTDGDDELVLSGDMGSAGWFNTNNITITSVIIGNAIQLPSYTVAGAPSAAVAGRLIYVSNESGGATLAFSDGTNWRRVQDIAIIS